LNLFMPRRTSIEERLAQYNNIKFSPLSQCGKSKKSSYV
jgi:hypothetical protein